MSPPPISLAFIIPKFYSQRYHEPQQQWHLFLNRLKKNPHYSISALGPLEWLKQKNRPDHIYIVANYLSALVYTLLLPPSIPKTIYLNRNRLDSPQPFNLYSFLSSLNLHPFYYLLSQTHHLTRLVFPDSASLKQFKPGSLPVSTQLLPSPLKPIKLNSRTPPLFPKKPKEKWLVCAGTALVGRGLPLLINTFKSLQLKYPHLKLILLLLPASDSQIILKQLKTLPQQSYYYHLGRLSPSKYFATLKQADIFIGPYSAYQQIVNRPATIIEAMALNIPVIISSLITDPSSKHNYNCLKFRNRNSVSLAQQIQRLLANSQLRKKITTQARKTIKKQANFSTIYQKYFLPLLNPPITTYFDRRAATYGSWFKQSQGTKYVNKLEKQTILKLLPASPVSLAEYGVGRGRLAKFLIQHHPITAYYGLDISPQMLQSLKKLLLPNLHPVLLPQSPKNPVDLILSFRQIKYNPHYSAQLEQMAKLLKPRGRVIIEFPSLFSLAFFGQALSSQKGLTHLINPFKLSHQLKKLGLGRAKLIPLRFLPDNLYLAANSPGFLNLIIKLENTLSHVLPPIFAKSLIITANKSA
jgi:glycosyltransferase involved in cell wall biosynthesis/SAM-dependent methyltransferase